MKLFKKLTVACMAICLCFGAMAMTACNKEENNGSSSSSSSSSSSASAPEEQEQGYNFKIVDADGNPVAGYFVQLCFAGGDACLAPQKASDANGLAFYKLDDITQAYDIHLLDAEQNTVKGTDFVSMGTIPANYDGGVIEIQLN